MPGFWGTQISRSYAHDLAAAAAARRGGVQEQRAAAGSDSRTSDTLLEEPVELWADNALIKVDIYFTFFSG